MQCQHCDAIFGSMEELQTHQIVSCPGILSDEDSVIVQEQRKGVQVIFKWLEDRNLPDQTKSIHLLITGSDSNIELKKGNGNFKSEWKQMPLGTFCGQLVIGDEIFAINEIRIEKATETVFIIIDQDETYDTTLTRDRLTTEPGDSQQQGDSQAGNALGLLNSGIGGLLSEEQFGSAAIQTTGHKHDERPAISPDLHTLQNVDNLTTDNSPRRDFQQTNELEHDLIAGGGHGFSQVSGDGSTDEDEDLQRQQPQASKNVRTKQNIDQMLHELSLSPESPTHDHHQQPAGRSNAPLSLGSRQDDRSQHAHREHRRRSSDGNIVQRKTRIGRQNSAEVLPSQNRSYGSPNTDEVNKMKEEMKRLKDLTDNYKEVKQELEVRCSSYDEEITRLEEECKKLKEQYKKSKEENEASVHALMDENEDLKKQCGGLNKELEGMKESKQVVDLPSEKQSNEDIEEKRRKMEELLNTWKAKAESYEDQVDNLKCQVEQLESERKQLKIMYQNDERVSKMKQVDDLTKQCQDYEEQIEQLKARCDHLDDAAKQREVVVPDERPANDHRHQQHSEIESQLQKRIKAYEDELTKKEIKIQQFKDIYARKDEESKEKENQWLEEKNTLEDRVHAFNDELEKVTRLNQDLRARNVEDRQHNHHQDTKETDMLIAQLEARCQSFDDEAKALSEETEKYKDENNMIKSKYTKLKQMAVNLKNQCQTYEEDFKKLQDENQSLETVRKIKEKDAENEKAVLEAVIKKLREQNQQLTTEARNIPKYTDSDITNNLKRLREDNKELRERLGHVKKYSYDDDNSDVERHQPQIKSPGRANGNTLKNYKIAFQKDRVLPSRPAGSTRHELSNDIEQIINRRPYAGKRTKSAENLYGENSYESRNQRYTAQTNGYHFESNTLGSSTYGSYDRLGNNKHKRNHSSGLGDNYLNSRYDENAHSIRPNNRHPKTKSYDSGMNNFGSSSQDSSPALSPRNIYSPTSSLPFCPTSSHEIRIGMKISLSRASGRLSRGQVKWIGTLPHHQGDYIGVELESESGKHDGTYDKVRYFKCKRDRGIFVQFKKIIMAWK
uniref:CAP-Gly domain-containing protein n=1 Tax=Clytia hemisphaerica TaxID=252671 RepID=A0A7M5WYY8_9CNID